MFRQRSLLSSIPEVSHLSELINQNLGYMHLAHCGRSFSTSFVSSSNWRTKSSRDGGETFCWPTDVSSLTSGFLAAADYGAGRVLLFDSVGQARVNIAQGIIKPHCVAASPDDCLLLTDQRSQCVAKFSCTGKLLMTAGHGDYLEPSGIAVTTCGGWVCSDTKKNSILVYNSQGSLVKEFGSKGPGFVQFSWPGYVASDSKGRIIIADNNNHAVKLFDRNGKYLCRLGGNSRYGKIMYPRGVCVDANDNIFAVEWGQDRINMYSPDARFVKHPATYNKTGLWNPHGLTVNNTTGIMGVSTRNPNPGIVVFKM